jgi:DNA repair exonuclease SbcCD nuclease subunit
MRLVHLSDLHLGFRQYQRLTTRGINQREWDVADAFRRAIDRTIAIAPQLVVVAGDVFHNVRPTNAAILQAYRQFSRLRSALPNAEVVICAGNHDTPRTLEVGGILALFGELGMRVADTKADRIHLPALDCSVLAVPDVPVSRPALVPDPAAKWNVLLLHGEVAGVIPAGAATADRAAVELTREELGASRWNYVALGHYHVHRQVDTNAWYSGSIEYTSANPWGELKEQRDANVPGKGFVEHDLATGEHRFHHLDGARRLLDLPSIVARGMSAADLDAAIARTIDQVPGGIDDQVVRLVVRDCPRHVARELDHKTLREYKRRALHFHLDTRRPEIVRLTASGSPVRRPSLLETVQEKLQNRILSSDIDREALVALGLHYLREAEAMAVAAPSTEGALSPLGGAGGGMGADGEEA